MTLSSEISTPFPNNFVRFCENHHFGFFLFCCSFTIKNTWKRDKVPLCIKNIKMYEEYEKMYKNITEQATLEEEIYERMVWLVTVKYKLFGL